MKGLKKRSLTCLLKCMTATLVLVLLLAVPVSARSHDMEGSCGENVQWTMDPGTSQLSITGQGQLEEYGSASMAPWFEFGDEVKSVILGSDVYGITAMDFVGCTSLQSFSLEEGSSYYKTENGVLFSADGSILVAYPQAKAGSRYSVPEGVQRIEDMAFDLCRELEYISIPDTTISIGMDAFANCTSLKKINMPDRVTDLGRGVFYACDSLEIASIGRGLKVLPADTFKQCTGLKQIVVSDTITEIGDQAFESCYSLRRLVLPASVKKIDDGALRNCSYLTDIYFSGSQNQWKAINTGQENQTLENAEIHYNSTHPASIYEYMYKDLSASDWYYDWVAFVLDNNIMLGKSQDTFSPNTQLTRAEMVQILYNYEGQPQVSSKGTGFADVKAGAWYENAIAWASGQGIVNGSSRTTFSPDATLTREQMVTILYRLSQMKGYDTENRASLEGIPDRGKLSKWAQEAFEWAAGSGIISGYADGSIHPGDTATRAQMAVVMKKYQTEVTDKGLAAQPAGSYEKTVDSLLAHPVMSLIAGRTYAAQDLVTAGSGVSAVWESSDTRLVNISDDGMLAASGKGTAPVRVLSDGIESRGIAIVRDESIKSLDLDKKASVNIGASKALNISASPSYGMNLIRWSSSDDSIASVDQRGIVTGHKPGQVTIKARAGSADASCTVTVLYPKAEQVLNQVGHDLKSAFKWSADMTYYGHNQYMPDTADPGIMWYADYGFDNHKGNCYVMAATFYEMAVNLGYSPVQMSGVVPMRAGGLGPHSWVEINIDGTNYVFDPDFQHETGRNGYMINYGQSGTWKYQDYTPMGL